MKKEYLKHVYAIANEVVKKLEEENTRIANEFPNNTLEEYDVFYDTDEVSQCITCEAEAYGKEHGWYGRVHNRHGTVVEDMTFDAAQMIAGASPSIEESFNGQYRKDMFRDVSLGALHTDIAIEIRKSHPEIDCYDFCSRGN